MPKPLDRLPNAEATTVEFEWNGRAVCGRRGDTLASALHAGGHRRITSSFKFHEPRGLSGSFVAGHMAIVDGVPHCRLDRMPIREGANVNRQNVWPSPRLDLLTLARLVPRRWLQAGFEHPDLIGDATWVWRCWERMLAFIAGEAPPPRSARTGPVTGSRVRTDIVVVGGGPAGVCTAAAANGRVALLTRGSPAQPLPASVTVYPAHEVFALLDGGRLVAAAPHDASQPAVLIDADQVVLATGTHSIPPLVRGNALPGVLDATTAIELAERHGVPVGNRVVVAATARGRWVADVLEQRGVNVHELIDIESLSAIRGAATVTGIEVGSRHVECDALVHAGPWRPDPSLGFHAAWGGELRLRSQPLPERVSYVGAAGEPSEPVLVPENPSSEALVCPCMDVTVGEVLRHVRSGTTHIEEIKRLTGCGMGACQGVPCWDLLGALLAHATGESPEAIGHPSYRPPRGALTFAQAAGLVHVTEVKR